MRTSSPWRVFVAVSQSWLVFVGLFAFGLSALVWLVVLARISLSAAYPLVALGIVITTTAGVLFFGENVSLLKSAGVVLIVAGVVAIALSI